MSPLTWVSQILDSSDFYCPKEYIDHSTLYLRVLINTLINTVYYVLLTWSKSRLNNLKNAYKITFWGAIGEAAFH